MTDVEHMKWWGWGVEGVGFHHEDKPAFAPFVLNAVGLDLQTAEKAQPPAFDDIDVADAAVRSEFVAALAGIVGEDHVTTDAMERVVHTYGKSLRDLVRIRSNRIVIPWQRRLRIRWPRRSNRLRRDAGRMRRTASAAMVRPARVTAAAQAAAGCRQT